MWRCSHRGRLRSAITCSRWRIRRGVRALGFGHFSGPVLVVGDGLTLGPTSSDGLIVPVHGSAATIESAFGVGFERYKLSSGRIARSAHG